MATETLTLSIQITYDPNVETLYDAQERFLETLAAAHLHSAQITAGAVNADCIPVP
jgi:hypothetical protein